MHLPVRSVDKAKVVTGAGVDPDLLAGSDGARNGNLVPGLQFRRLSAASLSSWLGVLDGQLHRGRELDAQKITLIRGHYHLETFHEEVGGGADALAVYRPTAGLVMPTPGLSAILTRWPTFNMPSPCSRTWRP